MHIVLGRQDAGADTAVAVNHRCRGLITRRFDAQDQRSSQHHIAIILGGRTICLKDKTTLGCASEGRFGTHEPATASVMVIGAAVRIFTASYTPAMASASTNVGALSLNTTLIFRT